VSLGAYVLRPSVRGIFTLWLVVTIVFVALRLSGDPATLLLSDSATAEDIARLRETLGLNQPLPVQYATFFSRVLLEGDLGQSILRRQPAADVVSERITATLVLALTAFAISLAVGLPAGIISAVRRNSMLDRLAMVGALFRNSMPTFWLGLVLMLVGSLGLGLFPSNGMYDIRSPGGLPDLLHHLVLPSITLSGVSAAILARVTRSSMLEVINREYVTTARAKGLSDRRVIWGHALKNAMLPVVTVMGVQLGYLLGGSILVETVFSWPGLGLQLFRAISSRDLPLVQGGVMLVSAIFVFLNLAIDLLYAFLDPRVRYS
jgi:peptide/nickel transport system permease protein